MPLGFYNADTVKFCHGKFVSSNMNMKTDNC